MYATEKVTDKVSARAAGPTHQAAPGRLSPVVGIAIYFLGVGVEALGLGLVAAYGLLAAGGALSICGLAIGLLGNRVWPAQPKTVSRFDLFWDSFDARVTLVSKLPRRVASVSSDRRGPTTTHG